MKLTNSLPRLGFSLKNLSFYLLLGLLVFGTAGVQASKKKKTPDKDGPAIDAKLLKGLKFRSIGPAYTGGRIADFAVHPENPFEYYVAVASGNVWKTTNAGTTWQAIFDHYGSYSIADVELDPNNPNVVWVGTGEYNSQRAIGYGDGVYKSEDGGKTFKNMGLKQSEHIGRIVIDPRNSDVYVAAQGPLWGPGGERGLYKSTDGGTTWKKLLEVSENTGITDVVIDPRNPDVLYCASYQRRRHVYTLIDGGPESAIYKSVDAGASWEKLSAGLPSGDVGRIGLTISPANPDYVYAIIELPNAKGGLYRTTNRGASWEKRSDHVAGSPQYYNRLFADPKNPERIFSVETYSKVSLDGGKNFKNLGNARRHVDDHALWIDPNNTDHLLIGGDGGIYETYDGFKTWDFKSNLPITQFYRVSVDNSEPFYYVYGGTQDNNSCGGPSRNRSNMGVVNDDWFVTNGGDGFTSRIDPKDPNIVYAQAQYGWLVRYDRKTGETVRIKPQPPAGEAYRWNWNAPLIISPHNHKTLYFAANKLFRSDDRGNSWKVISGDLSRQIDRNKLPVMGKIWSVDAVAKNASTSLYGNIVSLSESPLKAGLLYVGTDDGLVQVSTDGGENWNAISHFPSVSDTTYVSCLLASRHDENTVYAAFDARKKNDLKPYLLKSTDQGKTWKNLASDLPERGTVYTIAEDPEQAGLLFAGTEFGLFCSVNGGENWSPLKGGLPTIPVRDIAIQERENDLVIATFGRGFYILDDYSPLRQLSQSVVEQEFVLFPVKDPLIYLPKDGHTRQGHAYYAAKNPAVAATFTYYMKDAVKTRRQTRKAREAELEKSGAPLPYPAWEELRMEEQEVKPYLLFTITDTEGQVVRRIKKAATQGLNRVKWDLRYAGVSPIDQKKDHLWSGYGSMLVLPGTYQVDVELAVDGVLKKLEASQQFRTRSLKEKALSPQETDELLAFQNQVARLNQAVRAAGKWSHALNNRLALLKQSAVAAPEADLHLLQRIREIEQMNQKLLIALQGDGVISRHNANQPPSISSRVGAINSSFWENTEAPNPMQREQYKLAGELFKPVLAQLKRLWEQDVKAVEAQLDQAGAPWTPGRIPQWDELRN